MTMKNIITLKNGIIFAIAAAIVTTVCFITKDGPSKIHKAEHIFLISIDTIRADHLSSYGYQHQTTPNIDAFAQNAVLFENCFSNIPLTLPAHTSMLTGLIPPTHGVQDNLSMTVSKSVVTLPEILRDNGFSTYGIISAEVLDSRYGLDQGFDTYDDIFENKDSLGKIVPQRTADETISHAIKWLQENDQSRKFMFIHLYDPHSDYTPPSPYDKQFKHPYDGEIAFVDKCVGNFIDKLKSLDLYDNSLIIVTGDHAELLSEHKEPEHGYFIYHNVLKVPLIVKPAKYSTPARIADNTSLIDITPTILAQCKLEIPAYVQGIDLTDFITQKDHHTPDRYHFNECLTATKYRANSLLGVINDKWHYIQTTRPELYNIADDPEELNNLITQQPHRARIMQDQLSQILETAISTDNETQIDLNYESRQSLKSLGYVGGSVDSDLSFDQSLPDPKDLIDTHNDLQNALIHTHEGNIDKAIYICNRLIKKHPDIATLFEVLADAYIKIESYDKAIELLERKLALLPDDITTLKHMAETYNLAEDYTKAINSINAILKINPDDDSANMKLAEIYVKLDSHDKAIEIMLPRLAKQPDNINLLKFIAETYNLAEDYDHAIKHIKMIIQKDPENIEAYSKLAEIYIKLKQHDNAIALIEERLKRQPDDVKVLKLLANLYDLNEDYPNALKTVNAIIRLTPEDTEAYTRLAAIHMKSKSYAKAIEAINKILTILPDDIDTLKFLAEAHNLIGDYPKAIAAINAVLKLKPDDAASYFNLAKNYHHLKNTKLVLENCLKAIDIVPDFLPAQIYIADTYKRMGNLKEAIEHYEVALKLDSNLPFPLNSAAWIQATSKDPDLFNPQSALKYAQKAVELSADNQSPSHTNYPFFLDTLAAAQAANKQFDDAVKTANLAIKLCKERKLDSVVSELQKHLELYKQQKPYRQ